jgi:hypothetical protein
MKKAVGIIALVIVAAVIAGVWMLLSNLNSLVAGIIEDEGTKVTETSVTVSGVEIKLREGSGSIDNLAIASPPGYEADRVFSLGNITVDLDLESLRSDPIVIDEVRISAPEVNAEFKESGASNIDEIRKRVQAYSAGNGGGDSGGDAGGGEAKKIRIKTFVFEKGRIAVDASALGVEKRTVDLPEFRLTNLGGPGGATPDAIAKEVMAAVAKQVTKEIAQSEAKKLIEDQLGGTIEETAREKAKGLLDKISN